MSMPCWHVPKHRGRRSEWNVCSFRNSATVHASARLRSVLRTRFLRRSMSIGSHTGIASLAYDHYTVGLGPCIAAHSDFAVAGLFSLRGMRIRLSALLSGTLSAYFRTEFRHAVGDIKRHIHFDRPVCIASFLPLYLPIRSTVAFLYVVRHQKASHNS